MNHPLLLVLLTVASLYTAKLWREDQRAAKAGRPNPRAFPGATWAPRKAIVVAIAGALVLLAVETAGEFALGVSGQQSRMTWLFAVYSVCAAPIIEELIFRGWLVVENRGHVVMWGAAVAASITFTLFHPFLWRWDDAGFALTLEIKDWFSAANVFALSMWLYFARLAPWNPERSLLPCFAAHAAKNAGVVGIKATLGYMDGWW